MTFAFCCNPSKADPLPASDITILPTNQIAPVFGAATISATANLAPPVSYQWYFNHSVITGATNASLILGPLSYSQSGTYTVTASSAAGTATSSNAVVSVAQAVVSSGYNTNFQNFLLQFTNLIAAYANSSTVYALQNTGLVTNYNAADSSLAVPNHLANIVSLSLGDYANNLALSRDGTVTVWDYNNSSVSNVPSALSNVTGVGTAYFSGTYYAALRSDGTVVGWNNPTGPLTVLLSNATSVAATAGNLVVLQANGTVFESTEFPEPQTMTMVPGLSNVIAIATDAGSLALKADGTVAGWNGIASDPLPGVSNIVAISVGGTDFLALRADGTVTGTASSTQFPFTVTNAFFVNVNFMFGGGLAVLGNGSPVFALQPASQALTNGGTVRLHARAVGAQPMSYQWQLDGENICNATDADLAITNIQASSTGNYTVVASNQVGQNISAPATVTFPTSRVPAYLIVAQFTPAGGMVVAAVTTNGNPVSLANPGYIVEASANLINWNRLTNYVATNGGELLLPPANTNSTPLFYRLLRQQ